MESNLIRIAATVLFLAALFVGLSAEAEPPDVSRAVDALVLALSDSDVLVRRAAVEGLLEAGPAAERGAVRLAEYALWSYPAWEYPAWPYDRAESDEPAGHERHTEADLVARRLAADALVRIGPGAEAAVPLLREVLLVGKEKYEEQGAERLSVGQLGDPVVQGCCPPWDENLYRIPSLARAIELLGRLGPLAHGAKAVLEEYEEEDYWALGRLACGALESIGGDASLEKLTVAARESDDLRTRLDAVTALGPLVRQRATHPKPPAQAAGSPTFPENTPAAALRGELQALRDNYAQRRQEDEGVFELVFQVNEVARGCPDAMGRRALVAAATEVIAQMLVLNDPNGWFLCEDMVYPLYRQFPQDVDAAIGGLLTNQRNLVWRQLYHCARLYRFGNG